MYTGNILALGGAFLALAAAAPVGKRDLVWVTETAETVVTVPVTATVWVNANGSPVAAAAATTQVEHAHSWPHFTSHVQTTVTVPSPSAESTSVAPSSPTSVVVAPTTLSTTQQATSSTVVVPSTPATTPVAAPTTTAAPAPAPTTTAAPAPVSTTAASSGAAPSGAVNTGDITHYDVGEGSCGWTNTDGEAVVAIAHGMMDNGANPNDNPLCGRMITISYQGRQTQAKVVDTCMGCDGASIDLSPTLFETVAPQGNGRVHGVEWWFDASS